VKTARSIAFGSAGQFRKPRENRLSTYLRGGEIPNSRKTGSWIWPAIVVLISAGISTAYAQTLLSESLTLFPANVRPGSSTTISAHLRITDPLYIDRSAVLNEIDQSGKVVRQLAVFNDSGIGGDEIVGDKIYTAQFLFKANSRTHYSVAASIALRGSMQRRATVPADVFIRADADPTAPIATVDDSKVVFRDPSGRGLSSLPLQKYVDTVVRRSNASATETRNEIAIASQSQGVVVVFSHGLIVDDGANEGSNLPTILRYYKSNGILQYEFSSAQDRTFFLDAKRQVLSHSGDRVLLIEVSDDGTQPSVDVRNAEGQSIFSRSWIDGFDSIASALISSNGRYVGLVGENFRDADSQYRIVVLDIERNNYVERTAPANSGAPFPVLIENETGSFTLLLGAALEQLQ